MTPTERLMAKVDQSGGSCWTWTASRSGSGYGQFSLDGRLRLAHRAAYELLVGEIPAGLTIDHLCRNKLCVNPAHLEPVTQRINNLRGTGYAATRAAQTHCKRGHELTTDNIAKPQRSKPNSRMCKACHRLKQRAYIARTKAPLENIPPTPQENPENPEGV